MSWVDRIRPAAYTSPGGSRIEFAWESVSRETPKRAASFDAVGATGSYVQDNGHGGRTLPIRAIFSGPDCDLEADTFERALLERGMGRLEHPLYGDFDVVPSGSIARRDNPKSEANVATVEVTFLETLGAVFLAGQVSAPAAVSEASDAMSAAAGAELGSSLSTSTVAARAAASSVAVSFVDSAQGALGRAASATPSVRRAFDVADARIRQSMDILLDDPIELTKSLVGLIALPGQSEAPIASRLDAYDAYLDRLLTSPSGRPQDFLTTTAMPRRTTQIVNAWRLTDVAAMAAVSASASAAVDATYRARPEAIVTAARLFTMLDDVIAWRDAGYAALSGRADAGTCMDHGGAIQALQQAVALAASHLISTSFELAVERRIVLDRPRSLLSLAAELYGDVDDVLDFLIETNGLTGSEIIEIPAGREIVYYAT